MLKKLLCLALSVLLMLPLQNAIASKGTLKPVDTLAATASAPSNETVQNALKDFNSLKKSEKRSRFKQFKKVLKQFVKDKKAGETIDTNTLLLVLLSILIPPLAVYLHEGDTNNRFWISVLLTILGYVLFGFAGIFFLGSLPGIIYALIVVLGS